MKNDEKRFVKTKIFGGSSINKCTSKQSKSGANCKMAKNVSCRF